MRETIRSASVSDDAGATIERLQLKLSPLSGGCLVTATGELDGASRDAMIEALTAGDHRHMLLDFAGVTFMDSTGFEALVAARLRLESDGRMLTIVGFKGQPIRLLAILERLELLGHLPDEVRREVSCSRRIVTVGR